MLRGEWPDRVRQPRRLRAPARDRPARPRPRWKSRGAQAPRPAVDPTTWYLFSVNARHAAAMTIDSGQEVTLVVRGALRRTSGTSATCPTPFTPACDGHPLAPIAGPVHVRGAEPGRRRGRSTSSRSRPTGTASPPSSGTSACSGRSTASRRPSPARVRDGRAWFGGRVPIPLNPNLGTVSHDAARRATSLLRGPYGGDFDQKDVKAGSRVHLPVMVPGALVFFCRPARGDQRRHRHGHRRRDARRPCGPGITAPQAARGRAPDHRGRRTPSRCSASARASRRPPRTRTRAAIDVVAAGRAHGPGGGLHAPLDRRRAPYRDVARAVMAARLIIPREYARRRRMVTALATVSAYRARAAQLASGGAWA